MTTYAALAKSFNVGFRPEIQSDQIVAIRAKKKCCCWNNKELTNEISASKKALEWVKVNDTSAAGDAHIRTLFKDVSGRSRYYKSITSGFWAWLCALFRSKTTNRQLKDLAATLNSLQRVIADSPFFKQSIFKEARDHSSRTDIFERLKKEFPNLVINHEASLKDFGLSAGQSKPCVPFFIQKVKRNHKASLIQTNFDVILPPTPPFSKAQQVATIHIPALTNLPEAIAALIERNFKPFCTQYSCPETELEFNSATQQPPADKVNLTLEKDTVNGKCTLVAKFEHTLCGRQTRRLEMEVDCTHAKAKAWVDDIVNQNRQLLAEVNALLAQDPDFKINWTLPRREFTAQISNGTHTVMIESGNLSAYSFNRAKMRKDTYFTNKTYYNSLSDQRGQKVLEVSAGVFVDTKADFIGSFELTLKGLSESLEPYRFVLPSENLEQVVKQFLNAHCPFWETCRTLNPNFKTAAGLEQAVRSKVEELKSDASKSHELVNERALGWIIKGNQQWIKIRYWNPQNGRIANRKLEITSVTKAADVETFINSVESKLSELIKGIVTKELDVDGQKIAIEPKYKLNAKKSVKAFWELTVAPKSRLTSKTLTDVSFNQLIANYRVFRANLNYFDNAPAKGPNKNIVYTDPSKHYQVILTKKGNYKIVYSELGVTWKLVGVCKKHQDLKSKLDSIQAQIESIKSDLDVIKKWDNLKYGDYTLKTVRKSGYPLDNYTLVLEHPNQKEPKEVGKGTLGSIDFDQWKQKLKELIPVYVRCSDLLCQTAEFTAWGRNQVHFDANQALKVALSEVQGIDQRFYYAVTYYDLESRTIKKAPLMSTAKTAEEIEEWLHKLLENNHDYLNEIYDKTTELCGNSFTVLSGKSNALQFTTLLRNEKFVVEGHEETSVKKLVDLSKRIQANFAYYSSKRKNTQSPSKIIQGDIVLRFIKMESTNSAPSGYRISKTVGKADPSVYFVSETDANSLEEVAKGLLNVGL